MAAAVAGKFHIRDRCPSLNTELFPSPLRECLCHVVLFYFCIWITTSFATAQQPSSLSDQYIRTYFTVDSGLPDGVVNAILQTNNGLLWVGTESGLASFDGREFTPVELRVPGVASQGAVHGLVETPDGDLWVGTVTGLVRIPRAALNEFKPTTLSFYHVGSGLRDEVVCMHLTHDGVLWVGTNQGLYRLESNRFIEVVPQISLGRIDEALNGHLFLITNRGFLEWDGQKILTHPELRKPSRTAISDIFNLYQDRSGTIWYSTANGVVRKTGASSSRLQPFGHGLQAFRTYEDTAGTIWAAWRGGVYKATLSGYEPLLTDVEARSIFEDREKDLWIGTNGDGLIRLRKRSVQMFTTADGLPNNVPMTVLRTHDGKLWVGNNCGGISVLEGTRFKNYKEPEGLTNSCVWALAEDKKHALWVGTYGGGLFRFEHTHFVQYTMAQGLADLAVSQIMVAADGSLWIATPNGISHMRNGSFQNYTVLEGLSSNRVLSVYQDHAGQIWAATQAGLDRLIGEHFVPLSPSRNLDGALTFRLAEDSENNLYAATSPNGLSFVDGDRLVAFNSNLSLLSMAESATHDLWFSGRNGIYRIGAADLRRAVLDHDDPMNYAHFDLADGLNSTESTVGNPDLALTPDDKLWVTTVKGLAMIDISRLPSISDKPRVLVGAVTIGREKEVAGRELILTPGTHHIELHLEAVDLASPEKIRLQYRMDDVDPVWLDADASRTAIYTDIPVGVHSFHVRANNRDGVWDRAGITYNVTQEPFFYQTIGFKLSPLLP